MHAVARSPAVPDQYVAPGHSSHRPMLLAYVPVPHIVHAPDEVLPSGDTLPAAHGVHDEPDRYVLTGHFRHPGLHSRGAVRHTTGSRILALSAADAHPKPSWKPNTSVLPATYASWLV